eukprot:jgi/Tetstr1/446218/TSEL_033762.t1
MCLEEMLGSDEEQQHLHRALEKVGWFADSDSELQYDLKKVLREEDYYLPPAQAARAASERQAGVLLDRSMRAQVVKTAQADLEARLKATDGDVAKVLKSLRAVTTLKAHGVEAGSAPDWQGDVKLQKLIAAFTWARLHLEACFLRDAMVAVQTGYFGHLALMDFSAFFTNSIADIFEPPGSSGVSGWQAGIVYRPVKGAVAATSVWYVPQNHAAQAFALVTVALQMARPVDTGPAFKGEGYLDVHSQAMTAALHCCLSSTDDEKWWRSGGQQSALCDLGACGLKRGNAPPSITLNLLPCANNLAHVGGSFVRQCAMPNRPADALATKAVKWGQREFLSEVYGLFKVKDKSTGYLSTKSAIRDFITVYGDAKPALVQRYTDLVQALVDP